MKYLVIDPQTYKVVINQYGSTRYFDSVRGAKTSLTSKIKKVAATNAEYINKNGVGGFDNMTGKELEILNRAVVIEENEFKSKEPMVIKKCFMTGDTFIEPLNTPYSASRSSETFWSS